MRLLSALACGALLLAGCQKSDPLSLAGQKGLLPPVVDEELPRQVPKPGLDTRLGQMLAISGDHAGARLPELPPPPNISFSELVARSNYTGWESDRIDAGSYESLTASLNAIMAKMAPAEAQDFDKIVKYVLMQVTRDPLVAKKAATGGRVSDSELLRAIQSYVHDRTPREITELAQQFNARQGNQRASGPGNGDAMQAAAGIMGP